MINVKETTLSYLQFRMYELVTAAAAGCAYHVKSNKDKNHQYISGWTSEFTYREINNIWSANKVRKVTISELQEIPVKDLISIGFRFWDESLLIVPLWMFNYIADGEKLVCINGDEVVKGGEIDLDSRRGCISYGIKHQ